MRLRFRVLPCAFIVAFLLISIVSHAQKELDAIGKRNDFKITLLSLGSGSSRFTYERAINPVNSFESTIGIIGMGWDWMNKSKPMGLLMKMAYKWRLAPQKNHTGWLGGLYVKPELVLAAFNYVQKRVSNSSGSLPQEKEKVSEHKDNTSQMALLAECGYQLLFGWFTFDIYTGLGPSIGSGNNNNYFHSFMLFPSDGWLAFTAGFRVGFAF